MPTQDFNIYTARGYAGDLVDSGPRVVQTGLATEGVVDFGVALGRVTTSDPRGVVPSGDANVFAISQREWNHEAANRPSDGTTVYAKDQSVSMIRQGYIYIQIEAAMSGSTLYVTPAGVFTGANGGNTAVTNVVPEQAAAEAGEVIKARIDIVA